MILDIKARVAKKTVDIIKALATECTVVGCAECITLYQGPGQAILCNNHQQNLMDYGGLGKVSVPHSHHRKDMCEMCEYAPADDPNIAIHRDRDPEEFNRHMRQQLEVHHINGRDIPEPDHPDNCMTVCVRCHRKLTTDNQDYLRSN